MRQLMKICIFGLVVFLSPLLFLPAFAIDYSDPAHWLNVSSSDMPVDVVYLYPTAWQPAADDGMYSAIDEANMIAGANAVYERQATAFESMANVYAPYYRQMNLNPLPAEAGRFLLRLKSQFRLKPVAMRLKPAEATAHRRLCGTHHREAYPGVQCNP